MRPVRTIAALLSAATVGTFASAALAWAAPAATLRVSPRSVTAGDTVTVSGSVGPGQAGSACASGIELLSRAFDDTHEFAGVPAVTAAVGQDGTFATTTRIPRSRPAGTYDISGRCGGGNIGASATLQVRAAMTATTSTPATAPPATAPPATAPPATAPPATQPATSTADRWIIPGLVGLAVGALAALGVWLLFRHRHPTSA